MRNTYEINDKQFTVESSGVNPEKLHDIIVERAYRQAVTFAKKDLTKRGL